jgi:heme exporter protein C
MVAINREPHGGVAGDGPDLGPRAWLHPPAALRTIRAAVPLLLAFAVALCGVGVAVGFGQAPHDVGKDSLFRIVYVHVPATWVALLLYSLLVFWSAVRLMTGMRVASMMVEALAPTGALFALLALWTGSLWSKGAFDVWWDWDARRLADLTLLTFFVACTLMRQALDDSPMADTVAAALALLGAALLLFVLYSVDLIPRLHSHPPEQAGAKAGRFIAGLAAVTAGFIAYAAAAVLKRLRCVLLERERGSVWLERWRTER